MHHDHQHSFEGSDAIRQMIESGQLSTEECQHLNDIQDVVPSAANGCEDCLKTGHPWVNLRICLTCGYVGCCDSSRNKHATKHYQATGHPLIQSFEPGQEWIWCYVDDLLLEPA